MSCYATLAQLITIARATALNATDLAKSVTGITTDTRSLKPGDVFLALRGENFDGHEFVTVAADRGAIAAIVESPVATSLPLLQVANTLQAYQAIAHWWRTQFTCPVIAITGSVGKTTTKELIAAVLSQQGAVLKTQANYNNEIGVPKTLLGLSSEHEFAVVEMAMRAQGEIALLTQMTQPDIAVITNVGTAHIERLGSESAIAAAKCELLAEMPKTGIAVLNHEDDRLTQTAARVWQGKTVTFGLEGGDIHGTLLDLETLQVGDLRFSLPLPGRHNAINYLAALAVAKVLGIDWTTLAQRLKVELPGGRAKRYELPGDVVILDETYNAGLESMLAALQLLAQTPGRRRIAVLGTMKELGDRSVEFHHRVGVAVRDLKLDRLLILADQSEAIALEKGAAPLECDRVVDHAALVDRLTQIVQPGDRLLFKASRAVGLDRAVEQFRLALAAR